MKAILKFTTVFALLLVTVTGMAKEPKLSVDNTENARTLIFEWNTQNEDTQIQILDATGNIIFAESVRDTEVYTKKFNLNSLEEGLYFLKAENSLKTITYDITIDEMLRVTEKQENVKPTFRKIADNVYLNYLNLEGKKVEIKVVDRADRILFREVYTEDLIVEKAFNFKNAPKSEYTIFVKDSSGTYYEDVLVN